MKTFLNCIANQTVQCKHPMRLDFVPSQNGIDGILCSSRKNSKVHHNGIKKRGESKPGICREPKIVRQQSLLKNPQNKQLGSEIWLCSKEPHFAPESNRECRPLDCSSFPMNISLPNVYYFTLEKFLTFDKGFLTG